VIAVLVASRYNVIVNLRGGRALVYNSLSGATAILDPREYDLLTRAASAKLSKTNEATKTLLYGGFVVDDAMDELAVVEAEYRHQRYDTSGMVLTIAPTLACNFGCDYCFQGAHKPSGQMSIEVQDAVVGFVQKFAPTLKRLHVAWYGGEPLLAHNVIEMLSDRIIDVCAGAAISYDAMIVTNAYRLTPEIATSLYTRHVTVAQVTLDGTADYHDGRRALLGGQGTFERIIGNVCAVVDKVPLRIVIRINIDSRNSEGIPSLLCQLHDLGLAHRPNFSVYFAPVEAITEGCHGVAHACMSKSTYAALETDLHRQAFELGLAPLPYPKRFRGLCGALRPRGFVVVSNGDLHKCWDTVSMPQARVGTIFDTNVVDDNEQSKAWAQWSPFQNNSCRNCKLLPSCAGSCAHKLINPNQTLGEAASLPCPSWKYHIKERIVMIAERTGTITAKDYERSEVSTDPAEICPVPSPSELLIRSQRLAGGLVVLR
jgi:uncharacterized protein